uniref:Uncharacterized protein n=1 Tax=viral metagenome TaxID=1070528 RepID=A0A6M3IQK4_9ZZZZ
MDEYYQIATKIEGDGDGEFLYYRDFEGMSGKIKTQVIKSIEYGTYEGIIVFKIKCFR